MTSVLTMSRLLMTVFSLELLCCLSFPSLARADGVADFSNALLRLHSTGKITLDVHFKLFGETGEHKELIAREGLMDLRLEDDAKGMRVAYSSALIKQLHDEELAKIVDENVKNSALNAVGQFNYWEWRELLYPAQQLELALGRYQFLHEKPAEWNGKAVRKLTFQMSKEKVDVKFRKYIRKYKNHLQVWIDDNGVPLASKMTEKGTGRIFIVIGFTFNNSVQMEYQQHAGRLVVVRREVREETEGAAMQSHRHFIATVKSVQ